VTLDQIEQTILATFHDPRYFAIGRGAPAAAAAKRGVQARPRNSSPTSRPNASPAPSASRSIAKAAR
jgi:hypothetical protein